MNKSNIYLINGMSDDEIVNLLKHIVEQHPGCGAMRVIKAKANRPLVDAILRMTSFLDCNELSFVNLQTRIYMLIAGKMSIDDFPHCIKCGKLIKHNVISVHQGFPYEACSTECAAQSEQRKEKIELTNLERHGKRKWSNGEKISESLKNIDIKRRKQITRKFKATRQKHISENPDYWKDREQKSKNTRFERYGDETWNNRKQISKTKQQKKNEDPMYYERQQRKARRCKKRKYNDENFNNRPLAAKTKNERYGDPTFNNREKAKVTCLERYGVDNPAKNETIKEQSKQTCIERYGVDNYVKTDEFKARSKQTCIERYGVDHHSKTEKAREEVSLRVNQHYYRLISADVNEVQPLFSFEEYKNKTPLTEFRWKCKKCGEEFNGQVTFIWARNGGNYARCPNCYPLSAGKSQKQRDVYSFLKENCSIDKFKSEDRTMIYPYEIDIYDSTKRIGIEFDGLYWHSAYNGTPDNQLSYKSTLCMQKDIKLIHMFEDEWDLRPAQCKAKMKQILNIDEIAVKDYSISKISVDDAQRFLDENSHDIFAKASKHNLAMNVNGKTVSMMSFSLFNEKILVNEFCNAINMNISNSFCLFIKHIIDEFAIDHSFNAIQYNIDNRWPEDQICVENGFEFIKSTTPSKWLIDINQGWRRQCRGINENVLMQYGFDEKMNQSAFMHKHNLTYIVDCGNSIYLKKL